MLVRLSQVFAILAIAVGACALIYFLIIRDAQRSDVEAVVRAVDGSRPSEVYTTVADVILWVTLGVMAIVLLILVTAQVAFANRRPGPRWWTLGALVALATMWLLVSELVAVGSHGAPLSIILGAQVVFCALGLALSVTPAALRWSARQHDVAAAGDPAARRY